MNEDSTINFGVLGAAKILGSALIRPAAEVDGVRVTAIAARNPQRAREAAARFHIPHVHERYEELLSDPLVTAIYIPLPPSLHGEWTIRAIEAGKHVLCEKPFAANAEEARRVADAAKGSGLVVMEAFHYLYHPMNRHVLDVTQSGELGDIVDIDVSFCVPSPPRRDIRWDYSLAGGTLMDLGCYVVNFARHIAGQEPRVVEVDVKTARPSVDRYARARLEFPSGATGTITASMWSTRLLSIRATIRCTNGRIKVRSPFFPQVGGRVVIETSSGSTTERFGKRASYSYQLEAFRDSVVAGAPVVTDAGDAVANMEVIDAIYAAAGLPYRQPALR
jgi:predicted dehydrogenase